MAIFATADFTGVDGTALQTADANFIRHPSYSFNCTIDTNRCKGNTGGTAAYYHTGVPASANYSVSGDIYFNGNADFAAVVGRMSTTENTFYMSRYIGGSGWQLYKFVGGVATQLGPTVSDTLVVGNTYPIRLEMIDSAIKLFKRDEPTAAIAVTDSSITAAGRAGIRIFNITCQLDTFSATDLASGGTSVDLVISDSYHAHAGDGIVFTQNHILAISDSLHNHIGENAVLVQQHLLSISAGLHSHSAENIIFVSGISLDIANGIHSLTSTEITLATPAILQIQNATHEVISGNISLTQLHQLIIKNTAHSIFSNNIAFAGAVTVSYVLGPERKIFTTIIDLEQLYEVIADRRKFMLYQLSEEFSEFVLEKDRKQFTSSEDNQ